MRREPVLVPDVPKQLVMSSLVAGPSAICFSKTGLSETGPSAINSSKTGPLEIAPLAIGLAGIGLNDHELVHEVVGIIDEPAAENHEAVEWANWAAEFFRDAVEFELAAVLVL